MDFPFPFLFLVGVVVEVMGVGDDATRDEAGSTEALSSMGVGEDAATKGGVDDGLAMGVGDEAATNGGDDGLAMGLAVTVEVKTLVGPVALVGEAASIDVAGVLAAGAGVSVGVAAPSSSAAVVVPDAGGVSVLAVSAAEVATAGAVTL